MPLSVPPIEALIETPENAEVVRDQIAAVLLTETASQQALALAASPARNPNLWALRVYTERANPWGEFTDCPDEAADSTLGAPIVNVALDNVSFEMSASNIMERQKATAIYHVDCYGYGRSADDGAGHRAGDARAAIECQRVVRLVRKILMAATYTYLGLRGVVWRRWPQTIQYFQPVLGEHPVQHVFGARLALQVEFNEFSPQVTGQLIESVQATIYRAGDGRVYLTAQFPDNGP
jgi:hypothetical protein